MLAELDRVGGARLRARRLHVVEEPVVAEGALPDPAIVLALVQDAERTGDDAVAASVADVLLHHDRAELGPEERPGRAHVKAAGLGAVLADVGAHEPPESGVIVVRLQPMVDQLLARRLLHPRVGRGLRDAVDRHLLLDEGDVAPAVGPQVAAVVVGLAGEPE